MASSRLPTLDRLSLAEQVAQMVVVRTSGHLFDHEIRYPAWEADCATLSRYVEALGVGGVILLGGSAAEVGLKTQALQSQARIPLLIAADVEEGVGQRFSGATWFPPPMALSAVADRDPAAALAYAEAFGAATAAEALAIGLNWVLAPVVDVNNNPDNPVINVRAFGDGRERVSALTQAFIRGVQSQPVLTAAKHFPGHGDTATDSHLALPVLPHGLDRLHELELAPFRAAVAAGVDSIMTAHLKIPALDARLPATLSSATLTGLLRQEMGFDGLIVTDALIMGAIANAYGPYEAAVLAVEAGADVLLMPGDPEGAIAAVVEAVHLGRIDPARIAASVERLWRAKQKAAPALLPDGAGHAWEHLPPPPVNLTAVAQPATRRLAANILTASMTVQGQIAPSTAAAPGHNLVIVDDAIDCRFLERTAAALTWPQRHHYQLKLIDTQGCEQRPQSEGEASAEPSLRPSLVQIFVRGNPFRASAKLLQLAASWLEALQSAQLLRGIVIYGSPYALEQLSPYLDRVPHGFTYGQMPLAQSLILPALLPEPLAMSVGREFTD
ncbi:glycoside hydrolase family 3 N-terminal domain-containing protein [Nodosilinea sp. PGN35]|uniref:glycoside hydrolase family 3 N-terminal domain-containing protein n=1 Tax=Nodosilinea sp. PGN35 TaxID=3020489 RepID=UPI0023B315CD|nr:glycoside hydrolase family 3 N-terminal domain-containing protein [Nodosilinea sp. TSF1-S3]MDF0368585.1 glycoside hydrolase family 3 N-terminal domain-containing protein [Nodosilinea sp. TSF1-S3]